MNRHYVPIAIGTGIYNKCLLMPINAYQYIISKLS